jgi:phage terminase large subunit-like protein
MAGDGCENTYYTTSEQLADDVSEICLKLGYKVYISTRQRNNRKGLSYQVYMSKSKLPVTEVLTGNHQYNVTTTTKRKSDVSKHRYKGTVYCIGVEDTHTFLIRQNGSIWVSGNSWMKARYKIRKIVVDGPDNTKVVRWQGGDPNKPFIPSSLYDNIFIDQGSYENSLQELDPVRKEQLLRGDWDASPDSRFRLTDARFFSVRGEYYNLGGAIHHLSNLKRIFITMDPAATTKEGMIDQSTTKNGPSFTVISVWGLTHDFQLIWLYMRRFRQEIPNVVDQLVDIYRTWKPEYVKLESNGVGLGVAQLASLKGLTVRKNPKAVDKFQNATNAIYRMKNHRIWFPSEASWLQECMDEVFTWTGHPGMTDDIVDTLSDACNDVTWDAKGSDPIFTPHDLTDLPNNLPLVIAERLGNTHANIYDSSGYFPSTGFGFESPNNVAPSLGQMVKDLGKGYW